MVTAAVIFSDVGAPGSNSLCPELRNYDFPCKPELKDFAARSLAI